MADDRFATPVTKEKNPGVRAMGVPEDNGQEKIQKEKKRNHCLGTG